MPAFERVTVRCRIEAQGDRIQFRRNIILKFLEEEPGLGRHADTTRYSYFVEESGSGYEVELQRPTRLNKGFDFRIYTPGVTYRLPRRGTSVTMPEHADLARIMGFFAAQDREAFHQLQRQLRRVYLCFDPVFDGLQEKVAPSPGQGVSPCPADLFLLASKWLFAEQDLAYWNQSGRRMLMRSFIADGLMPAGSDDLP